MATLPDTRSVTVPGYEFYRNGRRQKPVRYDIVNPLVQYQTEVKMIHRGFHPLYPYHTVKRGEVPFLAMEKRLADDAQPAVFEKTVAKNRAIKNFQGKLSAQAELGMAVVFYRESRDMVIARAMQLYRAFKSLRQGSFRRFLHELGVKPLAKHKRLKRNRARDASSLWLEYWFGWSASVGDIYSAAEVLCGEPPYGSVSGSGGATFVHRTFDKSGTTWAKDDAVTKLRWKVGCDVRVKNPNLFLANQVGLVNPATVALDAIPFSWLIGWFVNVGQLLRSWTMFTGLEVRPGSVYSTGYAVTEGERETYRSDGYCYRASFKSYYLRRGTSFPSVKLVWSLPDRLSLTRAATAVSLLISMFIKGETPVKRRSR